MAVLPSALLLRALLLATQAIVRSGDRWIRFAALATVGALLGAIVDAATGHDGLALTIFVGILAFGFASGHR